ncbi:MAG: TM0106 family RecB-like putative nuclease [Chloroflexota bacterium]|nr:TM0106 family RecB-like putative nuclease [Chloroflexota bacterium]
MNPIVITATQLRHLYGCHRRIWLDAQGDPRERAPIDPQAAARLDAGWAHENIVQTATAGAVTLIPVTSWADGVRVTREEMDRGAANFMGAHLEHTFALDGMARPIQLRGKADRLRRATSFVGGQRRAGYIAVEIKSYGVLTDADRVQMDAYICLLQQTDKAIGSTGEFWLGRDARGQPNTRIQHTLDRERLRTAVLAAAQVIVGDAPGVLLTKGCAACPWLSACRRQPRIAHDLTLLSGLRTDSQAALRAAGINTLDRVAAEAPDHLRRFRGIKTTAEAMHAHARAWLAEAPIWFSQPPPICAEQGYYFDIETRLDTGATWCIGWQHDAAAPEIAIVAPARAPGSTTLADGQLLHLVPDTAALWRRFARGVSADESPIAHWTAFDATAMRHEAPADVSDALGARLHDLHASVTRSVRLPTFGASIKEIASTLGFAWSGYNSHVPAYADYLAWLHSGDDAALMQACAYQRDDVLALQHIWRWMRAITPHP